MHRIFSNGENQSYCQVPTVSAYTCGGIKLVLLYFARLDVAKQPLVLGHICYFRNIILLTLIMAEHIQTLNNALMKFDLCIAESWMHVTNHIFYFSAQCLWKGGTCKACIHHTVTVMLNSVHKCKHSCWRYMAGSRFHLVCKSSLLTQTCCFTHKACKKAHENTYMYICNVNCNRWRVNVGDGVRALWEL